MAAVDFYFIQDDGGMFKATMPYEPYFYVGCRVRLTIRSADDKFGTETIVEEWLLKLYEGLVIRVEREKKWDLDVVRAAVALPF